MTAAAMDAVRACIDKDQAIIASQSEEIRRLKLELACARTRSRSRSPRRQEIIASNTPDRAAEALGLVAANMVIRTTVESDMKNEIVKLKAEKTVLQNENVALKVDAAIAKRWSDQLAEGEGGIQWVFLAQWMSERNECEGSPAESQESDRLDRLLDGVSVRDFIVDIVRHNKKLSNRYLGRR